MGSPLGPGNGNRQSSALATAPGSSNHTPAPAGRLGAGGSGRAVTRPASPQRPAQANATRPPAAVDDEKVALFLKKYPTMDRFHAAFPEMQKFKAWTWNAEKLETRLGNLKSLTDGSVRRKAELYLDGDYSGLLEYGAQNVFVGLKKLWFSRYESITSREAIERTGFRNEKFRGDKLARLAEDSGYNIKNLPDSEYENDPRERRILKNTKIGEQIASIIIPNGNGLNVIKTDSGPREKLPGKDDFFRFDKGHEEFYRDLYSLEFTKCVVSQAARRGGDLDGILESSGRRVYRQIFLAILRTAADAPGFEKRKPCDRVIVKALEKLYETGDPMAARKALSAEARACWPLLTPRPERTPGTGTEIEKAADRYVEFLGEQGMGPSDPGLFALEPAALRPLVEDLIYCYYLTYEPKMRWKTLVAEIFDFLVYAPVD